MKKYIYQKYVFFNTKDFILNKYEYKFVECIFWQTENKIVANQDLYSKK